MRAREKRNRAILFIVVLLIALVFVYPLFMILFNSVKPLAEILKFPLQLPEAVHLENYVNAFSKIDVFHVVKNTAILTVFSVGGIVFLSSMTAWWTWRYQNRFTKLFQNFVILAMLIPFASLMLPLVQVMRGLHLSNNLFGGILTYWGIGMSFAFFMMQSAVKTLPVELEEAARIDGCSRLQTFFIIVLPLLRPTMISVILMDMFWIWNDFIVPLILLNSEKLQTIQLAINKLFGQYSSKWDIALPALVMTMLPIVIVFILLQKKIMEGVVAGAVKG